MPKTFLFGALLPAALAGRYHERESLQNRSCKYNRRGVWDSAPVVLIYPGPEVRVRTGCSYYGVQPGILKLAIRVCQPAGLDI